MEAGDGLGPRDSAASRGEGNRLVASLKKTDSAVPRLCRSVRYRHLTVLERVHTLLRFGDPEELNWWRELPPWLILGNSCRCASLTAAEVVVVK